ncbi:MAG TPA: outer membrane beta-barrel protein [Chitinophagaceae bacterium]|nr:outer membrane beta-barrel protein [Chitinophagaceae bacterium]
MKKILSFCVGYLLISSLHAQQNPETPKKKEAIDLSGRANDHLLIQLGYTGWSGQPDTINNGGFSKSFNIYFMFDFPFKTNPKLSVAIGPGISSDHIKFSKTFVDIKGTTTALQFIDQSDTNHFKRTKLVTSYLELPVEFRYTADPLNSGRGLKFAIGAKVGTMLNAHTRNKELQNKNGGLINSYLMKEASKRYFNTTRLSAHARLGWGHFSLYGSYQITSLFKDGVAAEIRPYSIGLTLSGL